MNLSPGSCTQQQNPSQTPLFRLKNLPKPSLLLMDPRVGLDSPLSMFFCYFLADLVGVAAGTTRPRRGDKTPASFAEYAVIEPSRSQKNKRGCPPKKRVAEAQPAQQQQQQQQHDDLSVIPGLPFLPDLGGAVREFMLGEGPKLSMEDIKHLDQRSIGGEQTAAASHRKRGLTCRIAQTGVTCHFRQPFSLSL